MSENKEGDPVDGGESSDRSLSDSWTVLDSSHFKDDGDLSDAESVEVLASEELLVDDISDQEKSRERFTSDALAALISDSCSISSTATVVASVDATTAVTEAEEVIAPPTEVSGAPTEDRENESIETGTKPISLRKLLKDITAKAFGQDLARLCFEVCIYTLIIDLVFLACFGLSSLSCILDQSNFSLMKNTKSYERYQLDPLSLQLSHVLAEWKKRPLEDHNLDRHLLKTMLLYYGGSTELSANLFALTEKVQKHNEIIKQFSKKQDMKDVQHQQMIVSGHLAHSIACILGKQDNDKSIPVDLFTTLSNGTDEIDAFAPEPGFWLNDWHLPQYLKANETFYRVDTKPVLPPMRNLFLHLGSAKWNQYFWKLYHQDEKDESANKAKTRGKVSAEEVTRKVSDDLEGEETERSPLDDAHVGDFISIEESSGNIDLVPETPDDDENDPIYPLFVNSLVETVDEDVDEDDSDYKFEDFGGYFEVLDRNKYFGNDINYHSRYECSDESCRQFQKINAEKIERVDDSIKSKLSELFDENALGGQQKAEAFEVQSEEFSLNEPQVDKKPKAKAGKRKYSRSNPDGSKGKSKQKKKDKRKSSSEDNGLERKKKLKVKDNKKKSAGGELHYYNLDDKVLMKKRYILESDGDWSTRMALNREKLRALGEKSNDQILMKDNEKKSGGSDLHYYNLDDKVLMKKSYNMESYGDWSTRMALNREKLRALSEKGNDQIWVFERARARRDMREETFTE
ncbi:uncharacterized protein LOC117645059 [Thrips palmi]|uniref:Uncharacterized protein LOC117645059 n=1 Tax=Thrips palmi TaxID=161013 RepID=A0A6P8ZMM2_THRPL|nr:uncharacterized protein LOC117645059 [Thrips palmi]XP_034240849.1 uncharacterized protein LOC117645059 [Thrips palmi]